MSTTLSSCMTSTAKNCFFRSAGKGLEDELNKAAYYCGLLQLRMISVVIRLPKEFIDNCPLASVYNSMCIYYEAVHTESPMLDHV